MSQFTPLTDPFDFLKKLWSPMGLPLAGMMPPVLDPKEIDKRITDLRSVETWLTMNLNVLRMTIQGLEMQRATAQAFQAIQSPQSAPKTAAPPSAPEPSPLQQSMTSAAEAWWSLLQAQTGVLGKDPDPKKSR